MVSWGDTFALQVSLALRFTSQKQLMPILCSPYTFWWVFGCRWELPNTFALIVSSFYVVEEIVVRYQLAIIHSLYLFFSLKGSFVWDSTELPDVCKGGGWEANRKLDQEPLPLKVPYWDWALRPAFRVDKCYDDVPSVLFQDIWSKVKSVSFWMSCLCAYIFFC